MTLYLGLDIATKTGWALWPDRPIHTIRTGSFKAVGDTYEQKASSLSRHLMALIQQYGKPDFCVIEQPQRNVQPHRKAPSKLFPDEDPGTTINAATPLLLSTLTGAAVGTLTGYNIPFGTVPVQSWRKNFFPDGWRGKDRQDWKRLAKQYCELLKIDVSNADEAEAAGVVFYVHKHPDFQKLRLAQSRAA